MAAVVVASGSGGGGRKLLLQACARGVRAGLLSVPAERRRVHTLPMRSTFADHHTPSCRLNAA